MKTYKVIKQKYLMKMKANRVKTTLTSKTWEATTIRLSLQLLMMMILYRVKRLDKSSLTKMLIQQQIPIVL